MKKRKITNTMQEVAVDILEELEVILMNTKGSVSSDKICDLIHKKEVEYCLCQDPFTKMLCTSKEYERLNESYYSISLSPLDDI